MMAMVGLGIREETREMCKFNSNLISLNQNGKASYPKNIVDNKQPHFWSIILYNTCDVISAKITLICDLYSLFVNKVR